MLNQINNMYICDKCLDGKEGHNTPGCVLCKSRNTLELSLRDVLLSSRSGINPMPWTKK